MSRTEFTAFLFSEFSMADSDGPWLCENSSGKRGWLRSSRPGGGCKAGRLGEKSGGISHKRGCGARYRSLPLTMIGNVPQTAILAATNERLKRFFGLTRRETLVSRRTLTFLSMA